MENNLPMVLAWMLFAQAVVAGGFSGWLASEKGRSEIGWMILGGIFGLFALVALAGAPALERDPEAFVRPKAELRWRDIERAGRVGVEPDALPWNPLAGPPPIENLTQN